MISKHCKPIQKSEVPKGIKVDLYSQRIRRRGRHNEFCIEVICIKCGQVTLYGVGSLRYKFRKGFSGCCRKCHPRFRPTKPKGGYKMGGGYRYMHIDLVEPEIVACAVASGLKIGHPNMYIAEHRVIAFRKFGPVVFEKGILVRHKNGVKNDNDPDNLLIGTNQDNVNDHVTSRREAALWRWVALMLFAVIKIVVWSKEIHTTI